MLLDEHHVQLALDEAVAQARTITDGTPASYIPELAHVPPESTSAAVVLVDGRQFVAGDAEQHRFTLQSSAKLIILAGLLEDIGAAEVFSIVGAEPTGASFASIARLETHGPIPANPLVNSGSIALCSRVPGTFEERLGWLERWTERLCGTRLMVNQRVLASERRTGDRNRAIAHLLKHNRVITSNVEDVLELYFILCSFDATVREAAHLSAVLASGGMSPTSRQRVLSPDSAASVVSLMATCGMYDESGTHLLHTGLPAKSGVSGVIVAVAPGRAGIAVASPRVNAKGGSVRGHAMLSQLSRRLHWHFALPG